MTDFLRTLPLLFAMGAAGGLHCAGMCGGLAVLATGTRNAGRLMPLVLYLAGKTSAYVFLGALAGALGETVVKAAPLGLGSRILALGGGLLLLVVGLQSLGVIHTLAPAERRLSSISGFLAGLADGSPGGSLLLGSANGLLPCPLVYGFLGLAAATGSTVWGVATMFVLGITSAVPLLVCSLLGRRLVKWRGRRIELLGGALMLVMAVLTLYRGLSMAGASHHLH